MLAYKSWKIVDDSDQFANVIHLIVFLITGKWVNFYFNAFCFFRIWFWTWQHDPFHTKIGKCSFVFKETHCLWVFSPRIWNVLWMRFLLKNLLHHWKIWRDDPKITKKLFFYFIFVLKICCPNIRDYCLNHSLNARSLRMPCGSVVSRRFYKDQWMNILVRIRSNLVLRLELFLSIIT